MIRMDEKNTKLVENKLELIESGNPICPRCKFGRLEPKLSNVIKRIEYLYGEWQCVNCRALYIIHKE